MQICAAADIHYPREGHEWCVALAGRMCDSGADVIVLAGDISAGPVERYNKVLSLFSGFDGPKLLVPGNHDLWGEDPGHDTLERYVNTLRVISSDNGFHYLPRAPLTVDSAGFAGGIGWYDYSYRQRETPTPGLRVTPLRATAGDRATRLSPIPNRRNLLWGELTDDDYAARALVWPSDDSQESLLWNDAIHIDWGADDKQVARRLAGEISQDAQEIAADCQILIGVCHFVPFEEMLGGASDDVSTAYCRAYMGSRLLAEAFADPKFKLVLCGHYHEQKVVAVGELVVANCSVAEGANGPLLITVPEE